MRRFTITYIFNESKSFDQPNLKKKKKKTTNTNMPASRNGANNFKIIRKALELFSTNANNEKLCLSFLIL